MQQTPRSNQLHIGLFGKCNVGKSTLMNKLLGQDLSIVSPVVGTTTDSVQKSIEWHPLGPVVLIDTAGIDDTSELGSMRVAKTRRTLYEVDFCLWVIDGEIRQEEKEWLNRLKESELPYMIIYNQKNNQIPDNDVLKSLGDYVVVNIQQATNMDELKASISRKLETKEEKLAFGDKVECGDVVILVTPQDKQAPKRRLILPQVQIIREILDKKAIPMLTTTETLDKTLEILKESPKWIITDSQVFKYVQARIPQRTKLTSFSILMAGVKGDVNTFEEGAKSIERLEENDRVLIAESCTHNSLHEDIAREKIPQTLQKKIGKSLQFEWVSGKSFPEDLSAYKLIIQCGGCMHTPKQIQYRIDEAKRQQIPITNFGVLLAVLSDSKWDY